jgi:hypothetical protein
MTSYYFVVMIPGAVLRPREEAMENKYGESVS